MALPPSVVAHAAEPVTASNRPYQPSIAYRADDFSTLRHELLRHLEEAFPDWNRRLAENERRHDMGVVLVELFAYMAEILGFYQDCRANEAYLRTAALPESLAELCRLIDYRPAPGAAASTLQAFLLKAGQRGVVPAGFRVRSQAADGHPSLVFETSRDLDGDARRNRLRLLGHDRSSRTLNAPGHPETTSLLLDQAYAGLKAGRFVVLSDGDGADLPIQLAAVTPVDGKTRVDWEPGAIPAGAELAVADLTIHGAPRQAMALAARERADELAAGENVVRLTNAGAFPAHAAALLVAGAFREPAKVLVRSGDVATLSRGFAVAVRRSEVRVYRGIAAGTVATNIRRGATAISRSVVGVHPEAGDHLLIADPAGIERVLVSGRSGSTIHLAEPTPRAFRVPSSSLAGILLYRVRLPGEDAGAGASESSALAPKRLAGTETELSLAAAYEGLEPGTLLVLHDGVNTAVNRVDGVRLDEADRTVLALAQPAGAPFRVATLAIHGPFALRMRIDGHDRAEGETPAGQTRLVLAGATPGLRPGDHLAIEGGGRAEGLRISALSMDADGNAVIDLQAPLEHAYPLGDTVVYGNVVPASHGETVVERTLGNGDRARPGQRFTLHRGPTTYLHDAVAARGASSTLELFVGDARWTEVDSLAASGPDDRHFVTERDPAGTTTIVTGDGRHGATLPTGRGNVRVRYRVGLGRVGNVPAGSIRVMPEPLPILEATLNPIGASGGADPEAPGETKRIAPVTLRALDRAVALADYADLARAHAGTAKARADWTMDRGRRAVRLTVAAVGGAPLTPGLKAALRAYLDARRPPRHRLRIREHTRQPVRLSLEIRVRPDFLRMDTKVRVERALGSGAGEAGVPGYFHFDRRGFGEDLHLSDVYALVESVPGVDSVVARAFHPEGTAPAPPVMDRIAIAEDALATGGDPADPGIGILTVTATGGVA